MPLPMLMAILNLIPKQAKPKPRTKINPKTPQTTEHHHPLQDPTTPYPDAGPAAKVAPGKKHGKERRKSGSAGSKAEMLMKMVIMTRREMVVGGAMQTGRRSVVSSRLGGLGVVGCEY